MAYCRLFIVPVLSLVTLVSFTLQLGLNGIDIENTEPKISRKQVCPPEKSSSLFRYHRTTKTCYKLEEKGPCGHNMVFHSEVNSSVFGECDCDFVNAKIPLVYHPATEQCFMIFTQAYCEEHEWLIFSTEKNPVCVQDKCADALVFDPEYDGDGTMVLLNDRCVPLNWKNSACLPNQVVIFAEDDVFPSCGVKDFSIANRSVYKTRTLSCKVGSRRDVNGKCRKATTIQMPDD